MRIISGTHKGRAINPPKNFKARPTTDFAKENLFNILENRFDMQKIRVLDLFSGTGGIAYEFASRGASWVDAIEIEPLHYNFISKAIKDLDLSQIHVIRNNAFKFLSFCHTSYDIIFADPPYNTPNLSIIPTTVLNRKLLNDNGLLILEHSSQNDFTQLEGFTEVRHYGSVNFSFFA